MNTLASIALAMVALTLWTAMYVALYRTVKRRGLSENWVLFGFSPMFVLPALIAATLTKRPHPPALESVTTPDGVGISALNNVGLMWVTVLIGLCPPFVLNAMAWFAMRVVPLRVDTDGVLMRSRVRHRWTDALHYTAFHDYLRLTFKTGVVRVQRPHHAETPAYLFTLQMLDRFNIHAD